MIELRAFRIRRSLECQPFNAAAAFRFRAESAGAGFRTPSMVNRR
jgi:hypothetical protein